MAGETVPTQSAGDEFHGELIRSTTILFTRVQPAAGSPFVQILQPNDARISLVVQNLANIPLFMGNTTGDQTTLGLSLPAQGGTFGMDLEGDGTAVKAGFWCSNFDASADIRIVEVILR